MKLRSIPYDFYGKKECQNGFCDEQGFRVWTIPNVSDFIKGYDIDPCFSLNG